MEPITLGLLALGLMAAKKKNVAPLAPHEVVAAPNVIKDLAGAIESGGTSITDQIAVQLKGMITAAGLTASGAGFPGGFTAYITGDLTAFGISAEAVHGLSALWNSYQHALAAAQAHGGPFNSTEAKLIADMANKLAETLDGFIKARQGYIQGQASAELQRQQAVATQKATNVALNAALVKMAETTSPLLSDIEALRPQLDPSWLKEWDAAWFTYSDIVGAIQKGSNFPLDQINASITNLVTEYNNVAKAVAAKNAAIADINAKRVAAYNEMYDSMMHQTIQPNPFQPKSPMYTQQQCIDGAQAYAWKMYP